MIKTEQEWWHTAVIYQIYPKSFQDSGNKGTGDLKGIIQRLDYLKQLGIDALWITPFYTSPQIDNGYDIADYYGVDPRYGTMDDFETLVALSHQKGIRIILDMVFNHTSTQHAWFQSALADPSSPYRNYYIWKDPVDGHEPNNWQSKFGGSAWQLDPHSHQYYLHLFSPEQADLNWENPTVRTELKNILRFWANKGVDGFRLDVVNLISKQQDFPNDFQGDGRCFYTDGPKVHDYLQELSRDVFVPLGSMTVGEMSSTTLEHCQRYSHHSGNELSMVFNFHHLKIDYPQGEKWRLSAPDFRELKKLSTHWQTGLHNKGWSALFWCNHDQPRIVSRFGHEGKYRVQSAKMLATTLHMMQGTPYIYQGEEIGMTNPHFNSIEQYRDVESLNIATILKEQGIEESEILQILANRSRDNGRTPMQWNHSTNGGFTQGKPWISMSDNVAEINVEQSLSDSNSLFYYYQKLILLRKNYPIITKGSYTDLSLDATDYWIYERVSNDGRLLVIANLRAEETTFSLPTFWNNNMAECLIHNQEVKPQLASRNLSPYEVSVWYQSAI